MVVISKSQLLYIAGMVLAVVAVVVSMTDTAKHDQQREITRQVEQVREMEHVPFATVTTTTLAPYVGADR